VLRLLACPAAQPHPHVDQAQPGHSHDDHGHSHGHPAHPHGHSHDTDEPRPGPSCCDQPELPGVAPEAVRADLPDHVMLAFAAPAADVAARCGEITGRPKPRQSKAPEAFTPLRI